MEKYRNDNEDRPVSIVGFFKRFFKEQEIKRLDRQQHNALVQDRIRDLLISEGRFMTKVEIAEIGMMKHLDVFLNVDKMFSKNLVLKQFTLDGRSVVFSQSEVGVGEIGYSPRLSVLFDNAGINEREFMRIQASYGIPYRQEDLDELFGENIE